MSSSADASDLVGFFSYSREDDEGSGGKLSKLRERIQEELRGQLGRTKRDFRLWQDKTAITHGKLWEAEIKSAIAEMIIIQLHGHALRGEQPRLLKRMLVFDEAHRVRNSERLERLAREGRAFGIGIVIGTQFPGDIPETMAGNLATQLFLMNNQAEHRRSVVKQVFGTTSGSGPRQLLNSLSRLRPLEGLFTNSHHQSALLRVVPHFER